MSNSTLAGVRAPTSQAAITLLARVLLSVLFLVAGYGKITNIAGTAGWFGSIGLPFPVPLTVLVGLLELCGGLAILVGFKTRLFAWALAAFTVAATLIAHTNLADQTQQLMFMKNLGLAGGFLMLAVFGPGALSVDARRG